MFLGYSENDDKRVTSITEPSPEVITQEEIELKAFFQIGEKGFKMPASLRKEALTPLKEEQSLKEPSPSTDAPSKDARPFPEITDKEDYINPDQQKGSESQKKRNESLKKQFNRKDQRVPRKDLEEITPEDQSEKKTPSIFLLIGLLSLIGLTFLIMFTVAYLKDSTEAPVVSRKESIKVKDEDYEAAYKFAETYLACKTLEEAFPLTLPDPTLKEQMEVHWTPAKENLVLKYEGIELIEKGKKEYVYFIYSYPVSEKRKHLAVIAMNQDRDFRYDWRSSVGMLDMNLERLKQSEPGEQFIICAIPKKRNYYNNGYKEDFFQSYKLFNLRDDLSAADGMDAYATKSIAGLIRTNKTAVLKVSWTGKAADIEGLVSSDINGYVLKNLSDWD